MTAIKYSGQLFVGFGHLGDLLAQSEPGEPLYLMTLYTSVPAGQSGLSHQRAAVCAQLLRAGQVWYCSIPCGMTLLMEGHPLSPAEADKVARRAQRVYERACEVAAGWDTRPVRATVAVPHGLQLLDGTADFLPEIAALEKQEVAP